jgi:hypothetical protein
MHYPVMTEKHVADRWQVSLKTLRRWRLDGEGPVWHKLFRHVRYHDADVLEFEHSSAQHLMTLLGIKRDFKPEVPEAAQGLAPHPPVPRSGRAQSQTRSTPDAGGQPPVFTASDPGMGDGQQRSWQRRCSRQ